MSQLMTSNVTVGDIEHPKLPKAGVGQCGTRPSLQSCFHQARTQAQAYELVLMYPKAASTAFRIRSTPCRKKSRCSKTRHSHVAHVVMSLCFMNWCAQRLPEYLPGVAASK